MALQLGDAVRVSYRHHRDAKQADVNKRGVVVYYSRTLVGVQVKREGESVHYYTNPEGSNFNPEGVVVERVSDLELLSEVVADDA